jgi:hypothetical protein
VKTFNYLSKQIISKQKVEGLIILIHRIGEVDDLFNWRPITLLNVVYKIYAKASQHIFQLIMMEIFHPNQVVFLSFCYVLENVVLQEESLNWAQ